MTFSIVARCPRSGALGVAVSSKALAAGALMRYVRSGVAAIASQAFANPYLGIDGLGLIEQGLPAERALERLIEADFGRDLRQLGIVDKDGRVACYTGERCIDWKGHRAGGGYACLGNILTGEDVIKAMANAFEASVEEDLPERLVRALEAGQDAGGDRRGRQSAGVHVMANEDNPLIDLRVDDHPDPVPELRRLLAVWHSEKSDRMRLMPTRKDFTPHWPEVLRLRDDLEDELWQHRP